MSVALSVFIFENRAVLLEFLTADDLNTLTKQSDPRAFRLALLSVKNGSSLIDQIIAPDENLNHAALKKQLLEKIINKLTPAQWYQLILSEPVFSRVPTLIEKYFQNNLQPDWLLDMLMSNMPDNNAKIALLTKHIANEDTTFALSNRVAFEKIAALMSTFNDEEKKKVILFQSSDNSTLIHRAELEGKVALLLDSIESPEIKRELVGFLRTFNVRQRTTHFLGLQDRGSTFEHQRNRSTYQTNAQSMGFEGMLPEEAMRTFIETLNQYQPSDNFSSEFDKIKDAFNNIDLNTSLGTQLKIHEAYYKKNNFVILPSGWPGHSITIAATNDYLIVANRGQGIQNGKGCIVYPLIQPLTKEDIKIFCEESSQDSIEQRIRTVAKKDNDDNPIIFHAFPLKAQKYGTCAIANKKAIIVGLLPILKSPSIEQDILKDAKTEYKRFTHATRLSALQELLDELNQGSSDKKMLLDAVIDYCNQHLDFKSEFEEKLIQQLILSVPETLWEAFLGQLSLEAKITVRYLKENMTGNALPYFIKEITNKNAILKPEIFSSLYEYFKNNHPTEFKEFLVYIAEKRNLRESPLILAAHAGAYYYAEEIIQHYNQDEKLNALVMALDNERWDMVQFLIVQDAKINNFILEKILKSENKETINVLFVKHPELITNALCYAGNGSLDLVQFLHEKGAKFDAVNENGVTPLIAAIEANNSILYHFLISNNADIHRKTMKGTAMSVACNHLTEKHSDILVDLFNRNAQLPPPARFRGPAKDLPLHAAIRLNLSEHVKILAAQGNNLNVKGKLGLPPLMLAIKYNNSQIVSILLTALNELNNGDPFRTIQHVERGLSFSIENGHSEMAKLFIDMIEGQIVIPDDALIMMLEKALQKKQDEIVLIMMKKFSNLIQHDKVYKQILFSAINNQSLDILNQLLTQRDPNTLTWNPSEEAPLFKIISSGNKENFQAWIKAYPDSIKDSLLFSFRQNENEMAMLLMDAGANINVINKDGITPVMVAATNGNIKLIRELLKRNAQIDKINYAGDSALTLAIKKGEWEIASLLIKQGASVGLDFMKKHLLTIIKEAKSFPHIAISFIEQMNESDVNQIMDENQSTALLWASQEGPPAVAHALLAKNADIHHQNVLGNTALICSAMYNQKNIAMALLRHGAIAQSTNKDGKSPLMYVNNLKLAKALIDKGASIEYCDENGQSALYFSLLNSHVDIASELIAHSNSQYLCDEFSKPSVLSLFNKLPTKAQATIRASLRTKLTNDQFVALREMTTEPQAGTSHMTRSRSYK
ncbi:ankyrin repeat domain-containing protein [Candidatus Berkiella cookevillensis]|uniref:Ankyrin repeat domain-containing protein n=1 Tax=Candidatus Berkiella cookevillensis TaxID=437022 RepID=A0A0Q9YR71_9GAMM|nr:ankyrin repeat domain-containing protein [Candidatus Berkiella cookevillensis]MCS5707923.1 ankyrin repeat domain-containing protein [Candidatus Berkiella cookevillensis]